MSLNEPGTIGDLELSNRGVFRSVRTGLVDDGLPTRALGAHLAARAAGGAGLVVGPARMLVHPSASGSTYLDAYDEASVDGLAAVADDVHDAGAAVVGQLTHTGGEETGDWGMQAQLAPSASPSDAAFEMPKSMDRTDVRSVQDGFATAAGHLDRAGFDGIELNAGPFSVLRQFLSPRYNTREDRYGGDWAGRARFVNETIDRVADATEGPVGLHLSLAELDYGGYEFDDVPALLESLAGFDYLSCTVGTSASFNRTHSGFAAPEPDLLGPLSTAADAVDVPVLGRRSGALTEDPDDLFEAGADFVCFTRQLLADERTVERLIDGERYDRCIECNQKCLQAIYGHAHGGHVECVVNPRTGRESELPPLDDAEPAVLPQRVLVVGGGPAGMRFGAVAARRGHDVTLREADDELGGQLTLAAQGPLASLARAHEDLEAALRDAGVTVELNARVTPESLEPEWETVVVATGATEPAAEGGTLAATDVLRGTAVGEDVLLVDENRWLITFQTALELLSSAESVEVVTRDNFPGFETEQPILPNFVAALQAMGATFTGNHALDTVEDGTVTIRNTLTGEESTRTPDDVVVAGRRRANEDLYLELEARHDSVYRIGDAVSPRKLDRAYYDAELLARRL